MLQLSKVFAANQTFCLKIRPKKKTHSDDHRSREFKKSIIPLVLVRHEVVITASDPMRALDVILTLALI